MAENILRVSEDGSLAVPAQLAKSIGLHPGDEVVVQQVEDGIRLRRISTMKTGSEATDGQRVLDWTEVERSRRDRM